MAWACIFTGISVSSTRALPSNILYPRLLPLPLRKSPQKNSPAFRISTAQKSSIRNLLLRRSSHQALIFSPSQRLENPEEALSQVRRLLLPERGLCSAFIYSRERSKKQQGCLHLDLSCSSKCKGDRCGMAHSPKLVLSRLATLWALLKTSSPVVMLKEQKKEVVFVCLM